LLPLSAEDRLLEFGLLLNTKKCVFGQLQLKFVGPSILDAYSCPLENKTAAIQFFPQPTTVRELQGFLWAVALRGMLSSAGQLTWTQLSPVQNHLWPLQ
jgi:hypothetical protein